MTSDTQPAMAYPTSDQYERWKSQAEEFDMSTSEFMQAMIEAGMKKFDATVEPDETNRELREQRNNLKDELDHARDRVRDLEEQVYQSEQATVQRYVENNPGTSFSEIVQKVIDTTPERVNHYLNRLEGEALRVSNGTYYPADGDAEEAVQ